MGSAAEWHLTFVVTKLIAIWHETPSLDAFLLKISRARVLEARSESQPQPPPVGLPQLSRRSQDSRIQDSAKCESPRFSRISTPQYLNNRTRCLCPPPDFGKLALEAEVDSHGFIELIIFSCPRVLRGVRSIVYRLQV